MPPETDNLQLEELFQADQKERDAVYRTQAEVEQLNARDLSRRKRVYAMMELKEVATRNDLYHAAVILHHGAEPVDYITAHRLATVAAVMGHKTARWLVAATLDRYLMAVAQPQLYGTQFEFNPSSRRYELRLPIAEAVFLEFEKEFLGVPTVAQRQQQLNARLPKEGGSIPR